MNTFLMILNMIPAIIKALIAIEAAIPVSGKGSEKLDAIRETLEIADATLVTMWPKIQETIGVFVKLFNKTGVFKTEG